MYKNTNSMIKVMEKVATKTFGEVLVKFVSKDQACHIILVTKKPGFQRFGLKKYLTKVLERRRFGPLHMGSLKINSPHDNSILCYTKIKNIIFARLNYLQENQKQCNEAN